MKTVSFNRILGILLLTLFSFSCSSDLDFNQANDLKLEPVFISNLAYFDIPANEFVTNGVEHMIIKDASDFDAFRDTFFRDNLKRVDLFFEFNNTINRAYTLDLVYLDKNNQIIHSTNLVVPAYTGAENLVTKSEIFENANLDLLKSTTKISFILKMAPGLPPLNENSAGSLKLRSSATAYLVVQ